MSSWFASLTEKATALSESALKATEQVVQNQGDVFQKLTLSTPELTAERQKIDQEERRKEAVHDKLAGLLPWETRDPDRDILVPECKEAILALSQSEATFLGPWQMPEKNVVLEKDPNNDCSGGLHGAGVGPEDTSVQGGAGDEGDRDIVDGIVEDDNPIKIQQTPHHKTPPPSPESLEKLAKLEPLPNLLADFDLDSHVGLIQRVLVEDKQLVQMQSQLSGGGSRECIFWKNYFFHCAYSRYEAGLSVDEVWSEEAILRHDEEKAEAEMEKARNKKTALQSATAAVSSVLGGGGGGSAAKNKEEQGTHPSPPQPEISFEEPGKTDGVNDDKIAAAKPKPPSDHDPIDTTSPSGPVATTTGDNGDSKDGAVPDDDASPSNNTATEYDIVDDGKEGDLVAETDVKKAAADSAGGSDDADIVDYEDPELDELEAEILKELED